MTFKDGLSSFLSTWSGVHTAYSFNQTNANTGTDTTHDANSSTYGTQDGYPNYGLAAKCTPDTSGSMDIYTITDVCMMLYLPSSGYSANTNYGLFHNGGGTNAQAGWCRYKTGTGWQICISHNASGTNQDETVYTVGETSGWFCVGFQYEDNSGNMALWVDGSNVSEVSRTYALLYGSGNPQIGDSNGDHPQDDGGWGAESQIDSTGILIANMVVDNPNNDNSSPAGCGDSFYTDYYNEHNDSGTEYTEIITESLSISDTLTVQFVANRILNESISISDSLNKTWAAQLMLGESVTIADSLNRVGTFIRSLTETVSIADSVAKSLTVPSPETEVVFRWHLRGV